MRRTLWAILLCLWPMTARAADPAVTVAEQGRYATYLLLHLVGSETYTVAPSSGGAIMTIRSSLSDRGNARASTTQLWVGSGYAPQRLEFKRDTTPACRSWRAATPA